jgi:hypothetical protein
VEAEASSGELPARVKTADFDGDDGDKLIHRLRSCIRITRVRRLEAPSGFFAKWLVAHATKISAGAAGVLFGANVNQPTRRAVLAPQPFGIEAKLLSPIYGQRRLLTM